MTQRVVDHGDLKKYRTEIPNMVFNLGLSPYEFTLYCHLKKTAGADGTCWKSTATLARETGMSSGMISKAKLALQQVFALTGGPLITVNEESNPKGGKPKHCITLTDIWEQNFKHKGASSPHEGASSYSEVASSPHERSSSPGEIKKELREERTKEETAHALLFEHHKNRIGKIPDGAAQGAAIKWILAAGFSAAQAIACYNFLVAETWRHGRVSWLIVKSEIGSWVAERRGNGATAKALTSADIQRMKEAV